MDFAVFSLQDPRFSGDPAYPRTQVHASLLVHILPSLALLALRVVSPAPQAQRVAAGLDLARDEVGSLLCRTRRTRDARGGGQPVVARGGVAGIAGLVVGETDETVGYLAGVGFSCERVDAMGGWEAGGEGAGIVGEEVEVEACFAHLTYTRV